MARIRCASSRLSGAARPGGRLAITLSSAARSAAAARSAFALASSRACWEAAARSPGASEKQAGTRK
ncbi:hypothetical protein SGLAM104S_04923 [Streptomyces glaucescens]